MSVLYAVNALCGVRCECAVQPSGMRLAAVEAALSEPCCCSYLSEYLEMPILPSNTAFVQPLLESVQRCAPPVGTIRTHLTSQVYFSVSFTLGIVVCDPSAGRSRTATAALAQ